MKKKEKNNKAFTLIEILAAVTILGILSIATIASVNKVIERSKEKHYKNAERQLRSAGQEFIQDNRSLLPKDVGGKNKIILNDLIEKKYINSIKDYKDKDCDRYKSYVQVYKYGQNKYSYIANLVCDNHNTNIENTAKPKITIKSPSKLNLKFEIEDQSDKKGILSYSYIITKGIEEINNSGNIPVPEESRGNKITKEMDIEKYTPGIIKLTVKATNIYGNTATKTYVDSTTATDKTAPVCIIEDVDKNKKDWIQGERTITVGCKDEKGGSGCQREKFTKVFSSSTGYGDIIISDKAGNQTKCKVSAFVDNTPPDTPIIINDKENKWAGIKYVQENKYKITIRSHDDHSGIASYQSRYPNSSNESETTWHTYDGLKDDEVTPPPIKDQRNEKLEIRVCDNLGNCSIPSSSMIKTDLEVPEIEFITDQSKEYRDNSGLDVKAQCKDQWSGFDNKKLEKKVSKHIGSPSKDKKVTLKCEDLAGNSSETTGNFSVQYNSRVCDGDYATCQSSACGYATCQSGSCGYRVTYYCCSNLAGSHCFTTDTYQGQYCSEYSKTAYTCQSASCGYATCQDPSCGREKVYCWHY